MSLTKFKLEGFASELASSMQEYETLITRCSSNRHLDEYMTPHVEALGECFESFITVEESETIPVFSSLCKDLTLFDKISLPTEIEEIKASLDTKVATLKGIVAKHTDTLTEAKELENSARDALVALQSRASGLKTGGKVAKVGAFAIAILGGLLAESESQFKSALRTAGEVYDAGEESMEEYRTLKIEAAQTFQSFSDVLNTNIEFVTGVVGVVKVLSTEISTLSATQKKAQLIRAKHQAAELIQTMNKYIEVFE
jgi:hypothetical protein